MKKILFVFNSLGLGGSQKIEAFVANSCSEGGYDVSVLSFTEGIVGVELNKDIPIQYVIYDRSKGIKGKLNKLPFLLRLRKTIKREAPDIVCVFLADMSRVVTLACKGLGITIIASERGAPGRHGNKLNKYKKAFEKCDCVVFQTDTASKYYNLTRAKTKVIPNPCIMRWHNDMDYEFREKSICGAGRLCKQKRFDVLIDAFNIVHNLHPDYKLYIYGSGELQAELQDQINNYDLQDFVELPGYVQDVFRSHGKPEVFVLSSDFEGIPNILLEAMALGVACVSTDCEPGGAKLLFDNERRGLLSPIGDADSLAANIVRVIEDKALYESLKKHASEVTAEYSVSNIKNMWLEIFDSIGSDKHDTRL